MTVARILNGKGRSVVTTNLDVSLQDVARELTRGGIGALIVVNSHGDIEGVISERDIVAAIAYHGPTVLSESPARHMTPRPPVLVESDPVEKVMELMTIQRRRHLPVTQEGQLAGLVSIGDVVKYRIEAIEYERKALRDYIASA